MKQWGDGDEPGERRTALDLANDMAMLYAQMFKHEPDSSETVESTRRSVEIMAALRAIPADAAARLADAERRGEKMRRALLMVQGGIKLSVQKPQIVAIVKAIEEALE